MSKNKNANSPTPPSPYPPEPVITPENPRIRSLVQDKYLASLGYRLINVKNYMIFYIIDEDEKYIKIIRFLYNKRNWMSLLKDLNK